ncbi:hypothetical protein HELRODRAFT_160405 [Helobdella robusta]|uniref:GAR domain-containing protein n=1 Tax=Helobdella robusta TaxID=6412 RepID=T1EQ77_HELRO|nr:hypothetical protein HELRODRAFT_160405 [Helobdella robusta]ESO06245.1 hypothetical protein HELRODRAFT_160405 [Helobdella robusta]
MSKDERMDDEMDRQFNRCCCDKRFLINKVDEGKYKFGESQKLHLVRIQRSCVMVRVGGGWMALDEFLTKHDPCRLRKLKCASKSTGHIFKSSEGISQMMAPFRSKQAQMSSPARTPMKCRQHNRDDEDKLLEEKSSSYADEGANKTSEGGLACFL